MGWLTITCDPRLCGRGGLGPRVSDFHLQSHQNSVSITLGIIIIKTILISKKSSRQIVFSLFYQELQNCLIQFCALREFGGTLSHLWILLRLSGPGWYYGEYHYQGRASSRNGRYSDKMNTPRQWFQYLGLSARQPGSLDRIRWIYLRNVIFGGLWIMHAMHQNQERIVTNVNLSKFRGITLVIANLGWAKLILFDYEGNLAKTKIHNHLHFTRHKSPLKPA